MPSDPVRPIRGVALYTAIDVGSENVKIATVKRTGGGIRLVGLGVGDVSEFDRSSDNYAAQVARVVKRTISRCSIPIGPVVVGLPGKGSMVRFISMPAMPPWKLQMAMEYELEEQVGNAPGGVESVAFDYERLPLHSYEDDQVPLMMAMAQNAVIEERMAVCRQGAREPVDCDFLSLGAFNLFCRSPQCDDEETSLLVDIGAEETHLTMQCGQDLFFVRTLPGGGRRFTSRIRDAFGLNAESAETYKREMGLVLTPAEEARLDEETQGPMGLEESDAFTVMSDENAEETKQAISDQQRKISDACGREVAQLCHGIQSSLRFFYGSYKLNNVKPTKLYLTGGGSLLRGLPEVMGHRLRLEVERLDVRAAIEVGRARAATAFETEDPAVYAAAIGLAVSRLTRNFHLSLLPASIRERREFWRRNVFVYYAAAAAVLILLLLSVRAWKQADHYASTVDAWETRLGDAKRKHEELERLADHNERIATMERDLRHRERSAYDLYQAIVAVKETLPKRFFCSRIATTPMARRDMGQPPRPTSKRDDPDQGFPVERDLYLTGYVVGAKDEVGGREAVEAYRVTLAALPVFASASTMLVAMEEPDPLDPRPDFVQRVYDYDDGGDAREKEVQARAAMIQRRGVKPRVDLDAKPPRGKVVRFMIRCHLGDLE